MTKRIGMTAVMKCAIYKQYYYYYYYMYYHNYYY